MDSTGITPVMNMGNDGMFGNGFMGIFGLIVLLAIINGGIGGFGGGNNQYATRDQVQNGFDTQNLQMQTSGILAAVNNGTAQTVAASTANATNAINAIKDGNAALIREFGNVETALTAMGGQMQNCCCETLRAIDGTNYNIAMQIAGLEQRISAKMDAQEITNLRGKVQALELAQATSNVLRFPNSWTFAGGVFPPVTTPAA